MPSNSEKNGNGLLLYHHYASFYSQKVVIALHEKRLNYKSRIVQLTNFEQYDPQFMRLNPKGQIPVLCDGEKVIPDSSMIIAYLEENYSKDGIPRLWPEDTTEFSLVESFWSLLNELPIETITYGCLTCPQLTKDMKFPKELQTKIIEANKKKVSVLENQAALHPELAEHYTRKRNRCWQMGPDQQSPETVLECLTDLEVVLDKVESRLASNIDERSGWWLCGDQYSVADIGLTVLLHRLDQLGLSQRFWLEPETRPHLLAYHRRLSERDSYRRACLGPISSAGACHRLKQTLAALTSPSVAAVLSGGLLLATACLAAAVLLRLRQ